MPDHCLECSKPPKALVLTLAQFFTSMDDISICIMPTTVVKLSQLVVLRLNIVIYSECGAERLCFAQWNIHLSESSNALQKK